MHSQGDRIAVQLQWILITVTDFGGEVRQEARIALSELLLSMQVLEACLEAVGDGRNRPVEAFLGSTPEGDQLCATIIEHEMAIMEFARDEVGRRLLCGPYPVEEARRMVEAVGKAGAR